jgi:hypothetical protein
MKNTRYFILLAFVLIIGSAFEAPNDGFSDRYAETITAADLRTHLEILASDEYEGRSTGQKGQKMAAAYISGQFKANGIPELAAGGYYQTYPLIEKLPGAGTITAGTTTFRFGADFFYNSMIDDLDMQLAEVVFAGYSISDKKYDDYKNTDVKGKVVMLIDGEPRDKKGKPLFAYDPKSYKTDRIVKVAEARKRGGAAVFIICPDYEKTKTEMKHSIEKISMQLDIPDTSKKSNPAPFYYITPAMAETILLNGGSKETLNTLIARIRNKKKPHSFTVKSPVHVDVTRQERKITAENVLGFVEGSDLKEEIIVVTAHYDHLGKEGDVVYNGADDDGSGTVAVIEMAQAFAKAKKEGHGPRRSMLFMTVSGEERGLLGSKWYTEYPVFPLGQTVCDLNIDMIGRVDEAHANDANYLYIIGADKMSSELHAINEEANQRKTKLVLDYKFNDEKDPNRFYYRSDHYNFVKKNVPVIFYFNGVHKDYHKETDEVSKIDFAAMEKRTRLVFYTAWELANRDKRITIDKKGK